MPTKSSTAPKTEHAIPVLTAEMVQDYIELDIKIKGLESQHHALSTIIKDALRAGATMPRVTGVLALQSSTVESSVYSYKSIVDAFLNWRVIPAELRSKMQRKLDQLLSVKRTDLRLKVVPNNQG